LVERGPAEPARVKLPDELGGDAVDAHLDELIDGVRLVAERLQLSDEAGADSEVAGVLELLRGRAFEAEGDELVGRRAAEVADGEAEQVLLDGLAVAVAPHPLDVGALGREGEVAGALPAVE
jgi:hypothetical protein